MVFMGDSPLPGMMVMAKFEQKNDTIVFSEGTGIASGKLSR